MTEGQRTLAVFDFDGTLVKSDSFFPFLGFLAGWPQLVISFIDIIILFLVRKWKHDPATIDYRTFFKAELLKRLVAGHSVSELPRALEKLCEWREWYPDMKQALLDHHAQGHHIVVASGGLDLYLKELLKDLPIDAIVCTEIAIDGGKLTGIMLTGNCVRQRKAELVAAYMAKHGPFDVSWGYGNLPHDLPMLELMQHRIVV